MRRAIAMHAAALAGRGGGRQRDPGVSRPAPPAHPAGRRFGRRRFCSICRAAATPDRRRRARARRRRLYAGARRARAGHRDRRRPARPICCASPGISATGICRCRSPRGVLRIRADHVIADMVAGLGGRITRVEAPFDPEIGAYAGAAHAHDHAPLSRGRVRPASTGCSPGCRRASRSAPSAIRMGSKPRSAAGRCTTVRRWQAWIAAIVLRAAAASMPTSCARPIARPRPGYAALDAANRRGVAFRATAELALESAQQGAAFLATCAAAWALTLPPLTRRAPPSPAMRERGRWRPRSTLSRTAGEGADGRSPEAGEGVCHAAAFGSGGGTRRHRAWKTR